MNRRDTPYRDIGDFGGYICGIIAGATFPIEAYQRALGP
jgi:hypothetical protein